MPVAVVPEYYKRNLWLKMEANTAKLKPVFVVVIAFKDSQFFVFALTLSNRLSVTYERPCATLVPTKPFSTGLAWG